MLLAIDIGNTNIVIGCIENDKITCEARIATDKTRTSDQYGVEIKTMLEAYGCRIEDVEDCIISSVVPPVFNAVRSGVYKVTERAPMVVGHGLKTGLDIRMDNPAQVGSDRIVIAVAALAKRQAPLILIDMGTATTVTVIDKDETFVGGVIVPGVAGALASLVESTALLPGIRLQSPDKCIQINTIDCMQSGVVYGNAGAMDGIIDRMFEELGYPAKVIACGGLAPLVIPHCRHDIIIDDELLLKGLDILFYKNHK